MSPRRCFSEFLGNSKENNINVPAKYIVMSDRFYVDTCIWMDLYEDRSGKDGEPLGEYALNFFTSLLAKRDALIISDLLIRELEMNYSIEEINGMVKPFEGIMQKAAITSQQRDEAKAVAKERGIPPGDAMHAIIARDDDLILVTRDRHFEKLKDICKCYKPEDIT